jgi:hypothetical protein
MPHSLAGSGHVAVALPLQHHSRRDELAGALIGVTCVQGCCPAVFHGATRDMPEALLSSDQRLARTNVFCNWLLAEYASAPA